MTSPTSPTSSPAVLAVDLGKTSSRMALIHNGTILRQAAGPGTPGLASPSGMAAAVAAIVRLFRALEHTRAPSGPEVPEVPDGAGADGGGWSGVVSIGAAGATAADDAVGQFAVSVRAALGASQVIVTNDVVTAHVGALGGAPGVVLIAGTGAAALAVSGDGACTIVDGAGWWLGDEGSGAWVGAEGLRAVLRAADGRGPATALAGAAVARFGSLAGVRSLAGRTNPAATAATFGPDIAAAARDGDPVAVDILTRASAALATTTLAAVRQVHPHPAPESGPVPVTLVGGLVEWGDVLLHPWRAALADATVTVLPPPPHAALLGAAALAERTDLPHERLVHRLPSATATAATGGAITGAAGADTIDVDGLPTEQVRPGLADLDIRRPAEIVDLMLAAEAAVPDVLAAAAPQLAAAIDLTVDRMADGGRLIYVGAGTPGRLAALDAAECGPTFGVPPHRVLAVLAGGDGAATTAVEGAEDDHDAGRADLAAQRVRSDDVVVGISASGRTPYVLGALAEASEAGAATVCVVNNAGSPIAAAVDIAVEVLTGPEVIAGSTRLTAGTAQKIALNVLSTATMVRLGKTYGGWMVDVSPGNAKLRRRALRIVREAAGVDAETASRALTEAGGETPTALVALLLGVDAGTARARLTTAGGRVRGALSTRS